MSRIAVMPATLMFIGATSPSHQHASTLAEPLQEQPHTRPADQHNHAVVADAEPGHYHNQSGHTHDTAVRLAYFPSAANIVSPQVWKPKRGPAPVAAFISRIDRPPCSSLTAWDFWHSPARS